MFSHQVLGDHRRNVLAPTRTRVKASPCHFFNLPPEIRNRIYGHVLPSGTVPTSRTSASYSTDQPKSQALLFTNRQIYSEAVYILYSQTEFAFTIFRWPTCSCFPRQMLTDDGGILASDVQVWGKESLRRIQCIDLAIFWHGYVLSSSTTGSEPQWELSKTTPISETRDWDTFLGNRGGLQAAVTDICDVFCELPQLRRINISWYSSCAFDEIVAYASPPRHDIPVLLRPLEKVRRALPRVIINMPVDSPISTTQLAQQQTNSGFKNTS